MTRPFWRYLLRTLALIIAVAGAIDPAIISNHSARPDIAVVAIDAHADSAQASRVRHALDRDFTVIPAPLPAADATVLVGDGLPDRTDLFASPVFALLSERSGAVVTIESVEGPLSVPMASRVSVRASIRVTGARGRSLDVTLRIGDLLMDRATRAIAADDVRLDVPLALAPAAPGAAPLRVTASLTNGSTDPRSSASSDLLVNVRDLRWTVLFFDARPSWMSTFVRRAIEADDRFMVTSRVVTSRNISTDVGTPPGRLDDLAALGLFDAVVVGAPDALSDADVSGLDAFLRRRGGSVVFLLDQWTNGPWQRLERAGGGLRDSSRTLLTIADMAADSARLRASEIVWPARLPTGSEVIARTVLPGDRTVIWQSAIGAGRLITSGALDAWRYRDPASSGFDRFWRTLVANAADAAPPPITVGVTTPVSRPGESVGIRIEVRDPALQFSSSTSGNVRAIVAATIESDSLSPGGPLFVPVWPSGDPGEFEGEIRAPAVPGMYRLTVTSGGYRSETPIRVAVDAASPTPREDALLAGWVASRGGRAFPGNQVAQLSAALTETLRPAGHAVRWHPMRSAWWILPFAIVLSGEWWLRRRQGLS